MFEIQSGISMQRFLASVVNLGAYYVLKSKGENSRKKEKKKKHNRLEFQDQREPNAGSLSPKHHVC